MARILRPDELGRTLGDFERRLQKLRSAPLLNTFPLISSANSAVQNQNLPGSGQADGVTEYDVAMQAGKTCVFTLTSPMPILWFSYANAVLAHPGGGFYCLFTTAVSLAPWNPSQVIFESGSQLFDQSNQGFAPSSHHFWIGGSTLQGSSGPGAAALGLTQLLDPLGRLRYVGPLPAGTYEVRQRALPDAGTILTLHDGYIEVFAPGG